MRPYLSISKTPNSLISLSAAVLLAAFFGYVINAFPPFYLAILLVVVVFPILFSQPKTMTYFCLAIVFFFPSVGWGLLEPKGVFNIYGRGTGVLHYSLVNILLWLTFFSTLYQKVVEKTEPVFCNLYKYFWIFNILFLLFILWGVGIGISFLDTTSYRGVLNVTNMTLLIVVMLQVFKTEKDLEQLKNFFLVSMVLRGVWGIIRFLFLGGDLANPYTNYQGMNVRITFFDIGDGLIACIAIFYAAWVLLHNSTRLSKNTKVLYLAIIAIGLFNIVFSYRRIGWIGLLLAAVWLVMSLPWKKRLTVSIATIAILIPVLAVVASGRFESHGGSFFQRFFPDIFVRGHLRFSEGRFVELYLALQTIKEHLLFGGGTWGEYKNISSSIWGLAPDFTHSSIVHMWLKMGLIGLTIFVLLFIAYIRFWVRSRKKLSPNVRAFGEATFAGFLFFIPDILFGTPIIEYRHMALLGFCLAIPYIAYNVYIGQKKILSTK